MGDHTLVVLASGRGTNLQSLLDRTGDGTIPGKVVMVVSDVPGAQALKRAEERGVYTRVLDYSTFPRKSDYERALVETLEEVQPGLICLAGYMRIVGPTIVKRFSGRIMNIHPSLLPAFPGLEAQRQALEYGVKITGCTVHFVDTGMDTGPIIMQDSCPVEDGDTPDTLAERILKIEHRLYPEAVRLFFQNKLEVLGRRVHSREVGK